jgi:PAS domain S-box-containing protein
LIRVLYVDDEPDLLEIGKIYLEEGGDFSVIPTDSARAGLTLLHEESFDAVISDYQMPVIDGIEFLKQIRRDIGTIPFIIFTGRGREEIVIEALNSGADFYLQKGGDPVAQFAELRHKVLSAIANHQAEEKIRQKTEELDKFFENALDLLCIADTDGNFRRLSRQWESTLGYSRSEMEGRSFLSFIHPDDLAATQTVVAQLSAGKSAVNFVNRYRCKDGSYRWIEWRAYPVGKVLYSAARDITERVVAEDLAKRAHEELEASYEKLSATSDSLQSTMKALEVREKLYSTLFHEMLNGIAVHEIICDQKGIPRDYRFLELNPSFEKMTGLRRSDLIGKTVLEVMPATEPVWIERYGKVALTGIPDHFENYSGVLNKYYEVTAYQNVPGQFTTIIADITDRKQKDKVVAESERKYRSLYHDAQVALFETRLSDARIVACNRHYCDLFGFTSVSETVGKDVHNLYVNPEALTEFNQLLREQGDIRNYPVLFRNLDTNRQFWGELSAFFDADRDIAAGSITDITERKHAEDALHASEEKFHGIFDRINDGIHIHEIDPDGRPGKFIEINQSACRMLQYSRDELLGLGPLDLVAGYHSRPLEDIVGELLATGHAIFETMHIRKDGTFLPVEINAHVVSLQGKEVIVSVVRDITDRQCTEQALKESERKYRHLIEHANEAIIIAQEGMLKLANPKMSALTGLTEQDLLTTPYIELIHPDDRALVAERHQKRIAGEEIPSRYMFRIVAKDNGVRWIEISAVRIYWEGRPATLNYLTDISTRRETEEALKQSELKYRELVESIRDVIFETDEKGLLTYVSPVIRDILDYTPDEMIGKSFSVFIHPDDKELILSRFAELSRGIEYPVDYRVVTKSGFIRWVRTQTKPIMHEGVLSGTRGTLIDINDRKLAEAALKESEEFNRGLVENIPDMVVVYSQDRKVRYVNPAVFNLFGYTPEELEGTDILSYVVPNQRAEIANAIQKRLVLGSMDSVEVNVLKKDGTEVTVITKGTFIRYHNDLAVLLLLTNISERKALETQLVARADELSKLSTSLEQTNRKLNLMNAITRHDITNQVSAMMGHLAIAKKRTDLDQIHELIDKSITGGRRLVDMIGFTREYEEIGSRRPLWQRLDLIMSSAERQHMTAGIPIITDTGNFEIFSDPMAEKVMANLIENTLRHGERVTTIRFTAKPENDVLWLIYEDDGIGIPDNEKEHIFERGVGKNTGLGLFLAREILSITSITIAETGTPGKGARFLMKVPKGMWRSGGKND